jgi:hypothetical protein
MPESPMRLIRRVAEFKPKAEVKLVPPMLRGIYVLYQQRKVQGHDRFDVQYVGMAAAGGRRGLRGRLNSHARSRKRGELWTHFSVYEVWGNVRDDEVTELEGLFRHIYRKDTRASALNIQRAFKKIKLVRQNNLRTWASDAMKPVSHR